ncbi:hypothetical protein [Streptomyces sp. NPDC057682]|uniref:hypothetical protein n=1 Tax=Streptomyces sp. NPDC057682 TaxID=3346210 RepID=UPI0036A38047
MNGRDWNDDSEYEDALRRSERAARSGWVAVTGTLGVLGCALVALAVLCVAAVVAGVYVVMAADS